ERSFSDAYRRLAECHDIQRARPSSLSSPTCVGRTALGRVDLRSRYGVGRLRSSRGRRSAGLNLSPSRVSTFEATTSTAYGQLGALRRREKLTLSGRLEDFGARREERARQGGSGRTGMVEEIGDRHA